MNPQIVNNAQNSKFVDLQEEKVKFGNLILPITNPQTCMLEFRKGAVVGLTITFERYVPSDKGSITIINPSLKCKDTKYHDLAEYDSCQLKLLYGKIDPKETEAIIDYEKK